MMSAAIAAIDALKLAQEDCVSALTAELDAAYAAGDQAYGGALTRAISTIETSLFLDHGRRQLTELRGKH